MADLKFWLCAQKYQPYASDPNLSGALASVLWELNLLSKHYHPAVSAMASSVSSTSTGHNQVYLSIISPQQAFFDLSLEGESFNLQSDSLKLNNKRKRGSGSSRSACVTPLTDTILVSDDEVRKKLSTHFMLLRDIKENERLRGDLDRTTFYLKLYEEHKKQRRKKGRTKPMKTEKNCWAFWDIFGPQEILGGCIICSFSYFSFPCFLKSQFPLGKVLQLFFLEI